MKKVLSALLAGLLLLMMPGTAWSQQDGTIAGTVIDADTEEPLPGATVQLLEEDIGEAANSEGEFSFQVAPGQYTVRASFRRIPGIDSVC